MVNVPPNPDNQIEATVVQESIKLPRMFALFLLGHPIHHFDRACQGHLTLRIKSLGRPRHLITLAVIHSKIVLYILQDGGIKISMCKRSKKS